MYQSHSPLFEAGAASDTQRSVEIDRASAAMRDRYQSARSRRPLEIEGEVIRIEAGHAPLQQPEGRIARRLDDGNLAHRVERVALKPPWRLDGLAAIDAEVRDLVAGQDVMSSNLTVLVRASS